METITIQNVTVKKQGVTDGRPWTISEVQTTDGRNLDTFDSFAIGEVAEVEITPNRKNPKYNANVKKAESKGRRDAASFKNAEVANKVLDANREKERRITMLSCISSASNVFAQRSANLKGGQLQDTDILDLAQQFFHLAWEDGTDKLPF